MSQYDGIMPTSYDNDAVCSPFNILKALAFEDSNAEMSVASSNSQDAWFTGTALGDVSNHIPPAGHTNGHQEQIYPPQTEHGRNYDYQNMNAANNEAHQNHHQTPQSAPPHASHDWFNYFSDYPNVSNYDQNNAYGVANPQNYPTQDSNNVYQSQQEHDKYFTPLSAHSGVSFGHYPPQQPSVLNQNHQPAQWYASGTAVRSASQQFPYGQNSTPSRAIETKPTYTSSHQSQGSTMWDHVGSRQRFGNYKILSGRRGNNVNVLGGNRRRGSTGYYYGKSFVDTTNRVHHTQTYLDKKKAETSKGLIKMIVNEATPLQIRYKIPQKETPLKQINSVYQKPLSIFPGALKQINECMKLAIDTPNDKQTPIKQKFSPTAIEFLAADVSPPPAAAESVTIRMAVAAKPYYFGHKKLKHRCPKCGERQATFFSLLTHVKSHCLPYCSQCCWMGETTTQLVMHKERAHPQPESQNRSVTMVTSKYGRKRQVHSSLAYCVQPKKSPKKLVVKVEEVKKEKADVKPPGKYFLRHSM